MREPVTTIAEQLAQWETPFVELDIFGTRDPERIFATIDGFVRAALQASIAGYLFQATSISSVHGVVLDDGREVVVKAKPPATTHPDLPFDRSSLEAIVVAQRMLHAAGFPCPLPVAGPLPLGSGLATIETYLPPADPAPRSMLARGLVEHMRLLTHRPVALQRYRLPRDRVFPQPHSKLFQPDEAATGWVQGLASRARAIAEAEPSPLVLGHADWRVEHVQARGDQIVATYDWDWPSCRRSGS